MSLTGYIKNLFIDKEKTIPLFPRTKVKAVSDDDGVGLNVLLDEIKNEITPMSKGGTEATDGATGLKNLFAAGETILSDYQYGPEKPVDGRIGQVFFEEATGTIADIGQDMAKALRARNLLDNSDFTNPVNQRGKTSYDGNVEVHSIDRWDVYDGDTVTIKDGYISKTGNLIQYIEGLDGSKVYTAAICLNDGTIITETDQLSAGIGGWAGAIYCAINSNGITTFFITSNATDVKWAALYEGEYTAETLPPYVPKGYGVELLECQRYYLQLKTEYIVNGYVASSGTQLWLQLPLAVPMRVFPTFKAVGGLAIRGVSGPTLTDTFTCQSVYQVGNSLVVVLNYTGNAYAAGTPVSVYFTGNPSLSADL